MPKQETLPLVEEIPKQGREAESQKWDWVEAEVWTGRMLATLENGVKGGRFNAYFIKQGLSTMTIAHVAISQSRCGPTNWRAGCGRSARPVRREGELKPMSSPYPYHSGGLRNPDGLGQPPADPYTFLKYRKYSWFPFRPSSAEAISPRRFNPSLAANPFTLPTISPRRSLS